MTAETLNPAGANALGTAPGQQPNAFVGPSLQSAAQAEAWTPNLLVRAAFYLSIFAIPFERLYLPGTGDRLGVKRILQALLVAAVLSRPKVCARFIPVALIWFAVYCVLRLIAGLWLAPEYSTLWWPSTLELLQFLLPWSWILFNVLQHHKFRQRGLWTFALGAALCAFLHVAGIGTVEVDKGIDGRSTIFEQNANEIGEIYGVALVALIALGLFRATTLRQRVLVFPLAALTAVALAKTGSRTGASLTALGIIILLPQTRAFMPRIKRYVTLLLAATIFAAVLYQTPTILQRFASAEASAPREESRVRMIPVLWEIFQRNVVYGSGPDSYQYELTRRAMPYLTEKQRTISSHNLALLLLVETGLIGFVVFGTGLFHSLRSAWRARHGSCALLPLAWLLPMSLAGLTISCPIFSPVFWLAIAYGLACASPDVHKPWNS